MPSSYSVLRMMIRSDRVSYPWFAPAGVRRGIIDNATRLGYLTPTGEFITIGVRQGVRDLLYESGVNPLMQTPQTGIIAFGQKTRASTPSSLDRVNISRLVAFMRLQLDKVVRQFLFEPNDKITRDEVKGVIDSFCNDLVAKRALFDYLVVCDESNNTPDRIDRNELHIDIAIEPVKAVEFIYIPIRIKNTGEIQG
jgi:phage tail sheath protein FI